MKELTSWCCSRTCLQLKFRPVVSFALGWTQPCVWSNPLQCLQLKNWKKNSSPGELTPPVLTGVKSSRRGEFPSNELYMHVFTRPGVTCCSASAFSRSFSLHLLQTCYYELLKLHKWFFKILFCVKCTMTGNKYLGRRKKTQKWYVIFIHSF